MGGKGREKRKYKKKKESRGEIRWAVAEIRFGAR